MRRCTFLPAGGLVLRGDLVMRASTLLVGFVLILAGCGEGEPATSLPLVTPPVSTGSETTTSTVAPPTTRIATSTTAPTATTSLGPAVAGPDFYRFGDDGLFRVADGVETPLESQSVAWATDDLLGGVVYRLHWQLGAETTYWLRADGSQDKMAHDPGFIAAIDGDPTVVMMVPTSADPDDRDMVLVDLRSGSERSVANIGFDGDGWSYPTSYGEGLFVGVNGAAFGCGYSDAVLAFWDLEGRRIDHPRNPVNEPCGPCELSAAISPDGRLPAYTLRGDAPSEYHGRLVCGEEAEWWNQTQEILAEVVVLDLNTGDEVFRTTAPAQDRLTDFDGRYVVVEQSSWSGATPAATILDTWAEQAPITVPGRVTLIRSARIDSVLVLRHDGLGVVTFGEPADSAVVLLIERLGAPSSEWQFTLPGPPDGGCRLATGYGCDGYFRSLSWDQLGLAVVLIDNSPYRDDGAPHFAGWAYWERAGGLRLATPEGIGIGATVADLEAIYADQLLLSPWLDECAIEDTWEFQTDGIRGNLSGSTETPTTYVTSLSAGVRPSC